MTRVVFTGSSPFSRRPRPVRTEGHERGSRGDLGPIAIRYAVFSLVHVADQCGAQLRDRGFDTAVRRRRDGQYSVVVCHPTPLSAHMVQEFEITIARHGGELDGRARDAS
ncbi:MAG: hypothetical protein ACRDZT_01465 [Acidimicrobiales bacterium]